jgi:hypothetical protein
MKINMVLIALVTAAGLAAASGPASAQSTEGRTGMMQGGADQQDSHHGMMGGSETAGPGMEQCMRMMHDDMGRGTMGQGMMGHGMMGSGMMGSGMMQSGERPGIGTLFGSRVRPVMNLSIDDVRGYLTMRLDRLNNKRLKIGDVKSDDATITADIVTVDNSLVQQLKVDRHTGAIDYVN